MLIKYALSNQNTPAEWVEVLQQSVDDENLAARHFGYLLENRQEGRNDLDDSKIKYDEETIKILKSKAGDFAPVALLIGEIYCYGL